MIDTNNELISQQEATRKSWDRFQENRQREWGLYGIDMGIHPLNLLVGGWIPTKVTTIGGRSGSGKAQTLDSKIYTPDGFTLMGNIKLGDIVLDESGGTSVVIGVFPQGKRKVYKITLNDGSVIKADENHLWKIYTAHDRKVVSCSKKRKTTSISPDTHSILSTKEMIGKEYIYVCKGRENTANLKLPVTRAVAHTKKDLEIPPYSMGALLGDGCFSKGTLSNGDNQVVERVFNELGRSVPERLKNTKVDYGIAGVKIRERLRKIFGDKFNKINSIHKYIPNKYLYSTTEDRMALLNGLMDTDGYASENGRTAYFYTSSKVLAENVKQLIESLGGVGKIKNRGKKTYSYKGEKLLSTNDSFSVTVNLPNGVPAFWLKRKLKRMKPKEKYATPRYIADIKYIGEEETQCIKVSNPTSLYITDNYVVTHNTALFTQMAKAGGRVVNGRRAEFLFFTWEMESSYLVDRYVCNSVGITNRMLQQGAKLLGDNKLNTIKQSYTEASNLPVTYQEMSTDINHVKALTKQFVDECKEKSAAEGVYIQPVVVIDYVQMSQFEGSGLRTYGIGDFMNGAKKIANDTGASFCIFAQIKRTADDKDMPERNDFADSQSIEMASDNLILIHRPEYNGVEIINDPETGVDIPSEGKMLIRALKGRDFGTGDILINCDVKYFRFWDINHDFDYEYHHLYENREFWMDYFGFH